MATTLAWRERERERERHREREREREELVTFLGANSWADVGERPRACAPHGILFQGIVVPGRRANVIERERERERGVGHVFGAKSWADVGIRKYICYI